MHQDVTIFRTRSLLGICIGLARARVQGGSGLTAVP